MGWLCISYLFLCEEVEQLETDNPAPILPNKKEKIDEGIVTGLYYAKREGRIGPYCIGRSASL